nr:hypothetical protein [Tanacetum cinerariifolium]
MQDDEVEPAELKEVIEVVTTAKLMTKVVTAATTTINATPSVARRRKGVVIRDPEETATPSVIVHSESKSKDKGKGFLVEEPKPLKKQAHIEQDEEYARELEAELNSNINWNEVIEQVKRKEKQDNTVKEKQEKDKIGSKPDKNEKRGEAGKSLKQLQLKEEEKPKKTKKEWSKTYTRSISYASLKKREGLEMKLLQSRNHRDLNCPPFKLVLPGTTYAKRLNTLRD